MGQPDMTGVNDDIMEHMRKQMKDHMGALDPQALLKQWTDMAGKWPTGFADLAAASRPKAPAQPKTKA